MDTYTPYKSIGNNVIKYEPFTQGIAYNNIVYQPTYMVDKPMNVIGVKKWAVMPETPFFKPFNQSPEYPAFRRIGGLPEKTAYVAYC